MSTNGWGKGSINNSIGWAAGLTPANRAIITSIGWTIIG